MKFDMREPCDTCPFLKVGGVRLSKARAFEIARYAVDSQGASFPCHKTVNYDEDGDADGSAGEKQCAGAMVFAEKQGRPNQIMRIMERLGAYDPERLRGHDRVFDTVAHMVRANRRTRG